MTKVINSRIIQNSQEAPAAHLQGTQETVSESHPDWRQVNRPPGDLGGNFSTKKTWAIVPLGTTHIESPWVPDGITSDERRSIYDGVIELSECQIPSFAPFPSVTASTDAVLNAAGTTAIAKCAPAEPTVNLATTLLETYHDGLPKLIGRSTWEENIRKAQSLRSNARTSGDEFLNAQFGWYPLVSDCADFIRTVIRMDKLLQQYIRDNGRVVRRRFSFPPDRTVSESVTRTVSVAPRLGALGNTDLQLLPVPTAQVTRTRESVVERWFSGAFVYHLPQTFFASLYTPFAANFQTARRLFGVDLSLDSLWELTPWSWAVDWFSNAGDVIHNASAWANGGLVMKYGYIMEHKYVRDTYTYVGPTGLKDSRVNTSRPHPLILTAESKVRLAANPFGFGLTMGSLSGLQKAILAALGLTRLR